MAKAKAKAHGTKRGCPACNKAGRSVGAMHYEETQVWDKYGTFSGGGIGLTTGGPGIGMGAGYYSEQGTSATKRAATFAEPEPTRLPFGGVIAFGAVFALALAIFPSMFMAPSGNEYVPTDGATMANVSANLDGMITTMAAIIPIAGIAVLWTSFRKAEENKKQENKINATQYRERLARYNQLCYCDACHLLYDEQGNARDANPVGFAQMMDLMDCTKDARLTAAEFRKA